MLNRQLQRPLSRSISLNRVLYVHVSSGRHTKNNSNRAKFKPKFRGHQRPRQPPRWLPADESQWKPWSGPKIKKPLFEELFPEEAKQAKSASLSKAADMEKSSNWVSQLIAELPEEADSEMDKLLKGDVDDAGDPEQKWADKKRAMLVLSGASKHLLESDFYRVGAALTRAKHVEGWVSGIMKVMQARDPDTLDPLGHYCIIFESEAAALAYREEAAWLWRLAKENTPGADLKKASEFKMPLQPDMEASDGDQDLRKLVDSFTLVTPSQRYDIELSRFSADDKFIKWSDRIVRMIKGRVRSNYMALLVTEGGKVSLDTLRMAIREDGVERNLPWRIKDLEGETGTGILAFGKSSLKGRDTAAAYDEGKDLEKLRGGVELLKDEWEAIQAKHTRYSKFIVPFLDQAEAQRFVRNWHRRQLHLQFSVMNEVGEEEEWSEMVMIQASMLW